MPNPEPIQNAALGSRETQGAFLDWEGGMTHGAQSYFVLGEHETGIPGRYCLPLRPCEKNRALGIEL